ncbi:beta-propeller domain-containing protein [Lysinibacillus sp. KU-BSD001]|uniref:beta-propeller domain-containing protein n=1 Tax=Lysinibacillus sp. KU-BSD001 TaxID=3141328 RepID=UPI0036E242B7
MKYKGKWYVGGVVTFLAVLTIVAVSFFSQQVQVYATSAIFENQQFHASFNEVLKEESLTNGTISITDAKGHVVKPKMSIEEKVLIIHDLPKGDYTIHVAEQAFKKRVSAGATVSFSVVDELQTIASLEDLTIYFQSILNEQQVTMGDAVTGVEEESMEMANSSSDKAVSHSETNNQVDGIEEGDVTVTDGKYIYTMTDQTVFITDAKQLKVVSKIELKDVYPSKLLLHDNKLIVLYDQYTESRTKEGYYTGAMMTKMAMYDVTNHQKPKLVREVGQEGHAVGVREYKDVLYIVTNTAPNYWLLREEEEVELRPQLFDSNDASVTHAALDSIRLFPGSKEANYTIVSAIDLHHYETAEFKAQTFLGAGSGMYMSTEAIYMTAPNYRAFAPKTIRATTEIAFSMQSNTELYKFAIDGTKIELTARTTLEGTVLNQFSMDEYNGYFRVATTTGSASGREANSNNHLIIYDERLNEVGKLTDLARGERIYSVRFMGEKAYIVTFKETDPLFVIDVADPTNPNVLGELKIPGFSNYLHPLDENHLIGIGYDTKIEVDSYSKQPMVYTMGMKVSLFDVTDVAHPIEVDNEIIGGRGTYSDVQHDHKALYRDTANGHYGFPIAIYDQDGYIGSGALVYHITPEGIELAGDLVTKAKNEQYEDWRKMVKRLLYIEDTLYTVANNEITAYNKHTFKKLKSIPLK